MSLYKNKLIDRKFCKQFVLKVDTSPNVYQEIFLSEEKRYDRIHIVTKIENQKRVITFEPVREDEVEKRSLSLLSYSLLMNHRWWSRVKESSSIKELSLIDDDEYKSISKCITSKDIKMTELIHIIQYKIHDPSATIVYIDIQLGDNYISIYDINNKEVLCVSLLKPLVQVYSLLLVGSFIALKILHFHLLPLQTGYSTNR